MTILSKQTQNLFKVVEQKNQIIPKILVKKKTLSKIGEKKEAIAKLLIGRKMLSNAIGRRKEAIAKIVLVVGTGKFLINGIPATLYLQQNPRSIVSVQSPIKQVETLISKETSLFSTIDTIALVKGGGLVGQADAIKLGLARALFQMKPEARKVLKDQGLFTQDSRVKERRKYGLKKARKASQYHKR